MPANALLVAAAIAAAVASASLHKSVPAGYDFQGFDCAMRQLAMEFAYDIAPDRVAQDFSNLADALNGSPHFGTYNCNITHTRDGYAVSRTFPLPAAGLSTFYVDAVRGDDGGAGTLSSPFRSVHRAVAAARAAPAAGGNTIVLRAGTYYFGLPGLGPILLSPADSGLTFQSYPGEEVWMSGGRPLPAGLQWLPVNTTGGKNIWSAALGGQGFASIPGLRSGASRLIRARYPNADPEQGFGSSITPTWIAPDPLPTPQMVNPPFPFRNDTSMGTTWEVGVGGGCAAYTPPVGYLCNNLTQRFGDGLDMEPRWPKGMHVPPGMLPNTPYSTAVAGSAVVHAWRDSHWFSRMHLVNGYDPLSSNFSFGIGGFQGGEGTDSDNEFYIENVYEELDAPGEWFYNASTGTLYVWWNASSGTPPPSGAPSTLVATQEQVLFNATGTQAAPVSNISFLGLGFRDTAYTYFEPHGLPSSGDWALQRTAALFFEGTTNVLIDACTFERLDGMAVFLSGYARGAVIQHSEFRWIGETAVALWGYSAGGPVPGMGWDLRAGDQPQGTRIQRNIFRELGIWEKQSSAVFQAEAGLSTIGENIVYNGPRAGMNFNDGSMGGNIVTRNLLLNLCRESGDHGPINSWDRTAYLNNLRGYDSPYKLWDEISYNLMIANYNSMSAVDNDDGSAYFAIHHNAFFYSPFGLKSDFGGHDKDYHDNVLFVENLEGQWYWAGPAGVWITYTQQAEGHQDKFYNNYMVQIADGDFAIGQVCNETAPPGWKALDGSFITAGGDVLPPGPYTLAAAQALCNTTTACLALTFEASSASPAGTIPTVYFKDHVDTGDGSGWYTWLLEGRPPSGVTLVANNSYFTPGANVTECGMSVAAYQALSPWNDPGSTVGALPAVADILARAQMVLGMA